MTTRYRVEYALKTHRRDQFIEWIKGLLAVPFVLHSQPTAVYEDGHDLDAMAETARRRYTEILSDVENLVLDHMAHQRKDRPAYSKLKLLVPSIGTFFTPLRLHDAFNFQDSVRCISSRRFVPPSFNDVRAMLNTAQVISLVRDTGPLELVTFDGDVTLYDDGESLSPDNKAISRLMRLLKRGIKIGIVTAAGYKEASKYHGRLHGLLEAIHNAEELGELRDNLVVMGGEANYLFKYNDNVPERLEWVSREQWILDEMQTWTEENITELLDTAERALKDCIRCMKLDAQILRKDRAVGIIPAEHGKKFTREQLEETVLVTQKILEMSPAGSRIPFCAFNGGNDVFVDIGDKSWGVLTCQRFFGGIEGSKTLHVGDQFLSAGANDFKARLACTTAWIASPSETVALLDEIEAFTVEHEEKDQDPSSSYIKVDHEPLTEIPSQPDPQRAASGAASANAPTEHEDDTTTIGARSLNGDADGGEDSAYPSSTSADDAASEFSTGTSTLSNNGRLHSNGNAKMSVGAQKKSGLPDTDAERADWLKQSQEKLGKFASRYRGEMQG